MSADKHRTINKKISDHDSYSPKESSILEGEDVFRRMFVDNNVPMLLYDPSTGRIIDANLSAIRFYGYTREKFLSLNIQDLYATPPEDYFAKLLEMATQGFTNDLKVSHRLANGEVRSVEFHTTPITSAGKIINFSIIGDVSTYPRSINRPTYDNQKDTFESAKYLSVSDQKSGISHDSNHSKDKNSTLSPQTNVGDFPEGRRLVDDSTRRDSSRIRSKTRGTEEPDHQKGDSSSPETLHSPAERDYEQILRSITKNTSAAIFIYQNNKIFYANKACAAMAGYEEGELVGKNFWEIIHPDFRGLEKQLGLARQRGESVPSHYEIKLIKRSGEELWVDISSSVINYPSKILFAGNELAVLVTAMDITDQRIARYQLEKSEEHYRLLVESAPDAIMVQSEGKIVYLNSAALKLFRIDPNESEKVIGKPVTEFVDAQSIAAVTAFFGTTAKSYKRAELNDEKFLRSDGSRFDTELVSAPTFYRGKPASQIIVRDVTNQKQAHEQLRLQSIALNTTANAIIITDRDSKIVWANPAFERLSGYTPSEFMGKKIGDLVRSGKHDEKFYKRLWDTIVAGKTWHDEIINRRKDGSILTEDMTITPVADENGTITHFIAINQDITERKSLEEQLFQAQKLESVGELAGGIAHDFNNILGVILGYSELLKRKIGDDDRLRQPVEAILSATKRGADLTKQILAFAQKGIISPEVIDVNSAIESITEMLHRMVGENIKLDFIPGKDLWKTKIDPSQFNQVLADLAANARDAIDKTGIITIETSNVELNELFVHNHIGFAPGKYVMVTFSDNGRGMDQETMERVFEPFFTTKTKGGAKGLGLSTVYGIVKRYKGNITVNSKPGAGTTFNIYLPRFYEEEKDMGENFTEELPMGTETILVVEDRGDLLQLVKASLEEVGYKVITAIRPDEALLLCKTYRSPIHLLLTDVIMPNMSGKELSDSISKIRPGIKTIFMSGYTANVLAPQGVLNKGINFLQKPFTIDELAKKIRDVLNLSPAQ